MQLKKSVQKYKNSFSITIVIIEIIGQLQLGEFEKLPMY